MRYLVTRTRHTNEHSDFLDYFAIPLTPEACRGIICEAHAAFGLLNRQIGVAEVAFYGTCGEFYEDRCGDTPLPVTDEALERIENGEYAIVEHEGEWPEGARVECERTAYHRLMDELHVYCSVCPKHVTEAYESVSVPLSVFEKELEALERTE